MEDPYFEIFNDNIEFMSTSESEDYSLGFNLFGLSSTEFMMHCESNLECTFGLNNENARFDGNDFVSRPSIRIGEEFQAPLIDLKCFQEEFDVGELISSPNMPQANKRERQFDMLTLDDRMTKKFCKLKVETEINVFSFLLFL